jgi:hypothetical protein
MAGDQQDCGHTFSVLTWTASDDKGTTESLAPDNLCPWSPARAQSESSDQEVVVVYVPLSLRTPCLGALELTGRRNANADEVRDCQRCKKHFSATFEMPEFWWSKSTRRSNGYFGCDSRRDEDGVMIGYSEFSPVLPSLVICFREC